MEITGMLYGARLLQHVDFPTAEVLGPGATEDEIQGLIDRHKLIFIKPMFRGGVGKKGKAGLIGKATDLKTALKEKERLYFVEHRHGNAVAKSNDPILAKPLVRGHDPERVDCEASRHGAFAFGSCPRTATPSSKHTLAPARRSTLSKPGTKR
jgi:hypothetical protein